MLERSLYRNRFTVSVVTSLAACMVVRVYDLLLKPYFLPSNTPHFSSTNDSLGTSSNDVLMIHLVL